MKRTKRSLWFLAILCSKVVSACGYWPVLPRDVGARTLFQHLKVNIISTVKFGRLICDTFHGPDEGFFVHSKKNSPVSRFINARLCSYTPCVFNLTRETQAVLSRAELLLSSGCSDAADVGVVVSAMEAAVGAWSLVEAEEAEKRRKEAEILKYKTQEHVVSGATSSSDATRLTLFLFWCFFPIFSSRKPPER